MKTYFYSAVIMIIFAMSSCSQPATNDASANNSGSNVTNVDIEKLEANNELVNRAIETGNFKGIDTLWTDDVVDHTGMMGKEVKGKDSVIAELAAMSKTMKDIKITTSSYAYDAKKNYFYTLSNFTATTLTAMDGMPANTKMNINSVDIVKIKDGKASEHWAFNDPNEMMKMMAASTKSK